MTHVWDYVVPLFRVGERRESRFSDLSPELIDLAFQIWRGKIVATPREILWYFWPVTVLTYLKDQSHASGQVIHEVAVEEPQTRVEEQQHISD
jgi:hypothetical protein